MSRTHFKHFDNARLNEYYPNFETFKDDYDNLGIPKVFNNEETLQLCYYVLMTRYGFSTVRGYNYDMFRPILFTRIWQYGGTWEKRLQIQEKLRSLSLDAGSEIYRGSKAIYNTALNPDTPPTTEELDFISSQNTTTYKKSTIEGLANLNAMLTTDVTEEFLDKFANLFKQIIYSAHDRYYNLEDYDD